MSQKCAAGQRESLGVFPFEGRAQLPRCEAQSSKPKAQKKLQWQTFRKIPDADT
jgi:hypothetical protein